MRRATGTRLRALFAASFLLTGCDSSSERANFAGPTFQSTDPAPLEEPFFQLRLFWPPPITGFLVRGASPNESPVYPIRGLAGGCDYFGSSIELTSHFAFTGVVTLEFIGLPAGVTDQTEDALTITGPTPNAGSSPGAPLFLQAADAQLGDATVTLRATGGAVVRERSLPIKVVEELPPCTPEEIGSNPPRPDQVSVERAEFDPDKQELRVEARECCEGSGATLWVTESATGEVIGRLEFKGTIGNFAGEFEGRLSWPRNPERITVISSPKGGWAAPFTVAVK